MTKKVFKTDYCGRELIIETGQIADFANGSVLIRHGDTVVLSTCTSAKPREGIDFFPLSVDYEEKMYAVGKIPGGFLKREGRPTNHAMLTSRMIDRPMRPLFPDDLRNEVTINNMVLSVDQDNAPEITAMLGAALATAISDVPWNGPMAGVQVALIDGKIILNPNAEQRADSDLELTVAGTKENVCMIEAGANEVPDDLMMEAIITAHQEIKKVCDFFQEIIDQIGKPKYEYESFAIASDLKDRVFELAYDKVKANILNADKAARDEQLDNVREEIKAMIEQENEEWLDNFSEAFTEVEAAVLREYLYKEHKRVDGRGLNDIRPLSAEVGLIPRVHGSALFQRGQTQVLNITTLAGLSDAQKLDGLGTETTKRYMHHYNFPSFSVGEARPNRTPGRREIGHGDLAERSLIPVLPSEEDFPYAIRTVSEVTMSNGSTSQGSVCASTLSLMDAGVPIKRPVAGISAGLLINQESGDPDDYIVFMDIQGVEDFHGDMDFKVAGTTEGITSIQVDIKVQGLSYNIIRDALELTRKGRLQIINETILSCIAEPRSELSEYAPKIEIIDIPSDKIGEVIGSGGKTIKALTEATGCEIDIIEDGAVGHVHIAAPNAEAAQKAIKTIDLIVNDPEVGSVFEGTVTRLMNFGAFVEFAPGKEGLVHISKMAWYHVNKVEDVVEPGQKVTVCIEEIDPQGRINLSMRDPDEKPDDYQEKERRSGGSSNSRSGRDARNNRRGGDRSGRGGRDGRDSRRSSGSSRGRDRRRNDQDFDTTENFENKLVDLPDDYNIHEF
ncbi:MAG: polyribonucleotide nucleotidyltransferase [Clostridiaceae bacterium]|nr:polyribonucleotide nucleotidyltransferase [Clostridiaceae bacterium]